MKLLLEIINTVTYFACVISIGKIFLGYRQNQIKYRGLYLMAIGIITATVILYSPNMWIAVITHIISVNIIAQIFFLENWRILLGLYIGTTAVLSMLSMLFSVVAQEIMLFLEIKPVNNVVRVINILVILLCIRQVGKYYENKFETGLRSIGIRYWILFMMILFFDSSIMVVIGDFILNTIQKEQRSIAAFLYGCIVIGLLIQLVLLINTLVTRNVHKENEKLAKQFLEKQNEHYQYLEKREYETKKFRHDIKNHLILLENFMSTKKYEEAQDYLSTINEKVSLFSNQISVNNGIADAILNRFYTEAKENGIILKVSGHFPMECYITAYDICTIFSNLLSNAILAETETEGKEVLVNIKYTDNKVLLTVENDYAHELNEVDGVFKTTKQDSLGHGYGLSNVKECVEKNGGYLSISTENHRFKVMIMILNENEEML